MATGDPLEQSLDDIYEDALNNVISGAYTDGTPA